MNFNKINWRNIPIITTICCTFCILLFIGINLEERPFTWEVYKKWGFPSAQELFNGAYWGLLTSNFLHTELWHILINLYWLTRFGKKIEAHTTSSFYILFILGSSLVSSITQLAFSDETGIGFSGVVYAQFGFLLAMRKKNETYLNFLDGKTTYLFLIWLIGCLILTKIKIWEVGNAAHVGGLFWGLLIAFLYHYKWPTLIGAQSLVLIVITSSIFWSPFSTAWLTSQAIELQTNEKIDEAMKAYQEILKRDADNKWAKDNLNLLHIYKLQQEAYHLHENKAYKKAYRIYMQILKLDTTNEWAKKNLNMLPDSTGY